MNVTYIKERRDPVAPIPAFPQRGQGWTVRCAQKS